MSEPILRAPTNDDWTAILRVANEALANAPDGNAGWLDARQNFDEKVRRRRHYVAESDGAIVAYGAIEDTSDPSRWRLFVVMNSELLNAGLGDAILERLTQEAKELGGSVLWMREQADDPVLLPFVRARGFVETRRFVVDSAGAYQGIEVVELERSITRSAR